MNHKILLIDDEAEKGWRSILEHLLFQKDNDEVNSATDLQTAKYLIKENSFDLIFLDLRFGENDHKTKNLEDFGGFKIIKNLKNDFLGKNFATPVILFTASNKAWYINSMIDAGCDDYYIKEHPNTAYDQDFTKQNTERLKKNVQKLLSINNERKDIHSKIKNIVELSSKEISSINIRNRIQEKLKIGYGILFKKSSSFEKDTLLFNNEILAFIVFWSILEEISHSYFDRKDTDSKEWILKKFNKKIQYYDENNNLVSNFPAIKLEVNSLEKVIDISRANQVTLSNQISAILRYSFSYNHHQIRTEFTEKLNKFRNKIDFIHSDTETINYELISSSYNQAEAFKKCKQMLSFVCFLLSKGKKL